MNVGALKAILASWVDDTAAVSIRAPYNPVLDRILATATVSTTATGAGGEFVEQLAAISLVFHISAPNDTAMDALLTNAHIIGSHLDANGATVFEVDL